MPFYKIKLILFHDKMDKANFIKWEKWSVHLWEQAENEWISRNGQDHFYRIKVVLPALEKELRRAGGWQSIIDLGCGDAFILGHLLKRKAISIKKIRNIVLIDKCGRFLQRAKSKMQGPSFLTFKGDLNDQSWIPVVKETRPRRLFLSIFLLQEIPQLDGLISNLREVFGEDDLGLFVTVAPFFANLLLSTGKMHKETESSVNRYFRWAAAYPIANNSRSFYLPYFHRTKKEYEKVFKEFGFKIVKHRYLLVPNERTSHDIFQNTLYGKDIINKPSGLLLVVKKDDSAVF
jgi:hypothetical protein